MDKRLLQFIAFISVGCALGYYIGSRCGGSKEEKEENARKGLFIGGLAGLLGAAACTSVNYILKHKGIKVYHGITYAGRLPQRLKEHQSAGKLFDSFECSYSKPRSLARHQERIRIVRDRPKYNVQHNCS